MRTMIAVMVPAARFSSILRVLLPFDESARPIYFRNTALLWQIDERAPPTQPTVANFVLPQVLALTYTAHDMTPFARDWRRWTTSIVCEHGQKTFGCYRTKDDILKLLSLLPKPELLIVHADTA